MIQSPPLARGGPSDFPPPNRPQRAPYQTGRTAAAPQKGGAAVRAGAESSPFLFSSHPSMALLPLLLPLLLLAPLPPFAARPAPTAVTVGVLLPEDPRRYPWALPRVGAALNLALEALQPQLSRAALAVRPVFVPVQGDRDCDLEGVQLKVVDLKASHDPDVLVVGSTCALGEVFTGVERLADHWSLPLLMAGGPVWKNHVPTTVQAYPTGHELSVLAPHLLRHFNWTSRAVFILGSELSALFGSEPVAPFAMEDLFQVGPNFTAQGLIYHGPDEAVQLIRTHGRVVFICVPLETLQEIMRVAQAQNMTNGDYVFFHLDCFGGTLQPQGRHQAARPWHSKEGQDAGGLREAFQTVLVITFHEPQTPEYRHFQSQLILRAQRDFGVALNDSLRLVAGCFHDALLLYIRALNETLHEGGTKRDTSHILEKMRDLKIQGVTGIVSMDRDIRREMDFDLWSMADVESGEFQVVGHYMGSEKQIDWLGPIHWKKGSPPLDNPPCVFDTDDPSCGKSECVQGQRGVSSPWTGHGGYS
ncbi:atrial natriuretic peptide receptor 2-like [Sphaerodactylus townsendi]|uniref:atrial natriuretic peptide receptor 2-like n=1 Tax=Sphaerodactylus townsendi TaxID=933632 RepID=UPI00202607DC|nr:atrial natriuretic peptide receptor 2-like [Sphaerodactylus townsendi]